MRSQQLDNMVKAEAHMLFNMIYYIHQCNSML